VPLKHVNIRATGSGNDINPDPYLDALPTFAKELPDGARAFATDPDHYDFIGKRCVKDLKLRRILFEDNDGELCITAELQHNCWKQEEDLTIRYIGVHGFTINLPDQGPRKLWHHDVILDEILPAPAGCSHEIACLSGSAKIVCRDLSAIWTEADCPDKP
jgi:hypothetical protein